MADADEDSSASGNRQADDADGSGETGRTDGSGETGRTDANVETGRTDEGGADPTDLFALLGDETRLSILRELAEERRTNWQWEGKTFAELRRAVGIRDSGQFNYHLEQLVGRFVVKDGDEYKLHNNGMELVGAIEAQQYADWSDDTRQAETDYTCPLEGCDLALVATYHDHHFELTCPDHSLSQQAVVPPSLLDHMNVTDLVGVADKESRYELRLAKDGVCPHCRGPTAVTLPAESPTTLNGEPIPEDATFATFDCERCSMSLTVPPGLCVMDHPAVVALFHDHGEDVRERPMVTLEFLSATHPVVESDDPVRVRVDVAVADDELSVWLDDDAAVVEYERS